MRYIEPVLVLHPVIKKRSMFGKDPESRAMQHLIHETNRAMSNIRMTVKDIKAELRKHSLIECPNAVPFSEDFFDDLEYLSNAELINNSLDEYYTGWQNHFNENEITK
jgi:hypothetical protein